MQKIAIACQGGSLHAVFTAGALKQILSVMDQMPFTIMGVSGTSAGALCAVGCWYGLHQGGPDVAIRTLDAIWQDFAACLPAEQIYNEWLVSTMRLQGRGILPSIKFSPYHPGFPLLLRQWEALGMRREFLDYGRLLEKHIDFAAVQKPMGNPWLLIGAVNVLTGEFRVFSSKQKGAITRDAIRASGALPWLGVRAVSIDGAIYWDGLYSQNPPLRNFLTDPAQASDKPDEIWVIQLNPHTCDHEPKALEEIQDRANELAANLALEQERYFIDTVNRWVQAGYLPTDRYKTVTVSTITLSPTLSQQLDFASKLDRSPAFVQTLMMDGEAQAQRFLDEWITSL